MFGLPGFSEVLAVVAFVALGGLSTPLLVRPGRRGGPLHVVRHFAVSQTLWPAVSIEARQAGLLPRMLALAGINTMKTTLDVGEELITFQADGLWRERRTAIPVAHVV